MAVGDDDYGGGAGSGRDLRVQIQQLKSGPGGADPPLQRLKLNRISVGIGLGFQHFEVTNLRSYESQGLRISGVTYWFQIGN